MIPLMQHAATALRLLAPRAVVLGTGDGDSLQNVNTTELPNGSFCWVVSNATLYRLDTASTLASAPDAVIVPASGPGRWIALSGSAALGEARMSEYQVDVGGSFPVSATPNTWNAIPTTEFVSAYAPQVAGAAFWSIAPVTGIATYSGPPALYHFNAVVNIGSSNTAVDTDLQISLTVNGEDIGTTDARLLFMAVTVNTLAKILSLASEIALQPGDTVQLIVRSSQTDELTFGPMLITGMPVGA